MEKSRVDAHVFSCSEDELVDRLTELEGKLFEWEAWVAHSDVGFVTCVLPGFLEDDLKQSESMFMHPDM